LIHNQTIYGGILFIVAIESPEGLLIFAFRPSCPPLEDQRKAKKTKQTLCVLGVSAVNMNIKSAPF